MPLIGYIKKKTVSALGFFERFLTERCGMTELPLDLFCQEKQLLDKQTLLRLIESVKNSARETPELFKLARLVAKRKTGTNSPVSLLCLTHCKVFIVSITKKTDLQSQKLQHLHNFVNHKD